jgi:catechol 2,3-dioxygenase-like lactoylglutathione lyase family enzyme
MTDSTLTALAGVHHVRLPVSDLAISTHFWMDLLGYQVNFEFPGADGPTGVALKHAKGGPNLVLWLDPTMAKRTSGLPWFAIGCPSADDLYALKEKLDERGIANGGIQDAFVQIKLPFVEDPDGHLIGFYVVLEDPPIDG